MFKNKPEGKRNEMKVIDLDSISLQSLVLSLSNLTQDFFVVLMSTQKIESLISNVGIISLLKTAKVDAFLLGSQSKVSQAQKWGFESFIRSIQRDTGIFFSEGTLRDEIRSYRILDPAVEFAASKNIKESSVKLITQDGRLQRAISTNVGKVKFHRCPAEYLELFRHAS